MMFVSWERNASHFPQGFIWIYILNSFNKSLIYSFNHFVGESVGEDLLHTYCGENTLSRTVWVKTVWDAVATLKDHLIFHGVQWDWHLFGGQIDVALTAEANTRLAIILEFSRKRVQMKKPGFSSTS